MATLDQTSLMIFWFSGNIKLHQFDLGMTRKTWQRLTVVCIMIIHRKVMQGSCFMHIIWVFKTIVCYFIWDTILFGTFHEKKKSSKISKMSAKFEHFYHSTETIFVNKFLFVCCRFFFSIDFLVFNIHRRRLRNFTVLFH